MKYLLSLSLLVLLLGACTPEAPPPAPIVPDEEFEAFYDRFHEDPAFQLARVQFPLRGLPARAGAAGEDFRWQRTDWQHHQRLDPATTGLNSDFAIISDDLIVESIRHKSGAYGMERRFARLDHEWYLIYYAGLRPVAQD